MEFDAVIKVQTCYIVSIAIYLYLIARASLSMELYSKYTHMQINSSSYCVTILWEYIFLLIRHT